MLGLFVLHCAFCMMAYDPGPYPGGDNGTYVSLARGILERGVYVDYWDPAMAPHTMYPPVFPLLLAGGMALGLSVWAGVKALCIAFSAAAVSLAYLWLRRVLTPRAALMCGVIIAIIPGPLALANQVLSDVPFWTWVMLSLWAFAQADAKPEDWRWEALAVGGVVLGFFTRSAGLPLAVAAAAWMLLHRRWRALGMLAVVLGPLAIAWGMRTRAMGGTSAYAREFWWINPYVPSLGTIGPVELVARMLDNLRRYATQHTPVLFFGRTTEEASWVVYPAVLLVALAVAGWASRLRRATPAELFVPLYVGLLVVWPATWGGERFLLPLLPLLLAYAALALRSLGERIHLSAVPPVAAAVLVLLALPGIGDQARLGSRCREEFAQGMPSPCLSPEWSDLLSIAPMLRGRLPAGSVVIDRKPTLFFAASGYRSRMYPKSESPDTFFAMVRETGAQYVVLDRIPDMSPYLHAVVHARREKFCIVTQLSLANAALARIVPDGPPLPPNMGPDDFRVCPATGPALAR
jgi:4-amino-4-deoxy-L-arabinose transferase-like glycosyltransferase